MAKAFLGRKYQSSCAFVGIAMREPPTFDQVAPLFANLTQWATCVHKVKNILFVAGDFDFENMEVDTTSTSGNGFGLLVIFIQIEYNSYKIR